MVCVLAGVVRRCFSTSTAWEGEGLPGRPDRGGATVWEDDTDDEIVFEKRRGDTKVVEKGPTKQLLNDKPKLQMSHEERKSLNVRKDLLKWEEEKVLEVIRQSPDLLDMKTGEENSQTGSVFVMFDSDDE